MSAFNNNNNNLNNTSAGIEGRGSTLASKELRGGQQPGELNENHGIAATGLRDLDTHSSIPSTRGNELNYAGADIADTNKIDQQAAYGNTAGQNLNSDSKRTGGTGIPPVNTAEHVRRNATEEAIASGHHGLHHHSDNRDLEHERSLHSVGNGPAQQTGHAGVGLDDKALLDAHRTPEAKSYHHPQHPVAVGPSTTPGQHATGAPLGAGLPDQDLKHSSDKRHNEKYGNASNKEEEKEEKAEKKEEQEENKVGAGDKIKGNLEKLVGKISGNEAKVVQGENIAQGRSI